MKYYNYSTEDIEVSVLHKDITDDDVLELMDKSVKDKQVDLIIGGSSMSIFFLTMKS